MTGTDAAAFLDRLEALHAQATPGPWRAEPNMRLRKGCRCLSCWERIEGSWDIDPVDGPDCPEHGCWHNIAIGEADAAAIVADHNAAPRLVAAVRAAYALAEELRYKGEFGWGPWQEGNGPDMEGQIRDGLAADLRAALDEALEAGR